MTTAIEREEQVRESHVSIGQAEVTILERDSGFTAIIGDDAALGFVEIHDGLPAAGLIDPTTDEPAHSIHLDASGKLVVTGYQDGEPANIIRIRGPFMEVEEPTTVTLGRARVHVSQMAKDGSPLVILEVDGKLIGSMGVCQGWPMTSLCDGDGKYTHAIGRGPDGQVRLCQYK